MLKQPEVFFFFFLLTSPIIYYCSQRSESSIFPFQIFLGLGGSREDRASSVSFISFVKEEK